MTEQPKPWFRFWPTDVPKTLHYPGIPLHEILRKSARENPENTAIIFRGMEIDYSDLDILSNKFASALNSIGVINGARVALFLPNIPQFVIAYYAILKAGGIVTAISPLHKEREVEHQLCDSEAETIIALDSLYPIVDKVWANTKLKHLVFTSLEAFGSKVEQKPGVYSFQQLLDEGTSNPLNVKISPSEDLAALQYTGGTTGTAKGAMLTHTNLVANAVAFATWIRGSPNKATVLAALPLFHIYGMTTSMNVPIALAAKIVLLPKFEPVEVLETIQRNRVTVFCGSPVMYQVLLANPDLKKYDLTSVRVCISGASPLPSQIQKKFMQITGGLLAEGYGLTEASPVTHCSPVDTTLRTVRVGSIGLPLPDTDARIVDAETGQETLQVDETGELIVKGPQVMKGYWRKPVETARFLRDGWLFTGDIARMDSDGYFFITDRKKDLIKYKDYSVYPREIEDVLYEHPAVRLCSVVGKPDESAGEIPKAFVVLKHKAQVTAEEIMQFVENKVAPYKRIREVEFRTDLPMSSAGKVLKRLLKEEVQKR